MTHIIAWKNLTLKQLVSSENIFHKYADEIGVEMIPFKLMTYVKECAEYMAIDEVPKNLTKLNPHRIANMISY